MFELSDEGKALVKRELERYEDKYSAIIPSLYQAQKENNGWVSPDCVDHLSVLMDIPHAHIKEVLNFYTMFNKEPVGKYHIQICCNLTCAMYNGRELTDHVCSKLNVTEGEVTEDGRFTVTRVECLGSCDNAPAVQVNEKYYDSVTTEAMDKLIEELK